MMLIVLKISKNTGRTLAKFGRKGDLKRMETVVLAPFEVVLMLIMIKFPEEPEAIGKFGDAYRAYKKQVPWFCFKRSCLEELVKDIPKVL